MDCICGLTSDSSLRSAATLQHTTHSLRLTLAKHPTRWCFLLHPWLMLSVGLMEDAANQIPVLPPRQTDWSSHYTALPAMNSELPGNFQMVTSESLSQIWICEEPWSTISLTVCLSFILAWVCLTAALTRDDGNLVFEIRSHSMRNKPPVWQKSPAVSCNMPFFSFPCFPFPWRSLSITQQPKECQGRSWPQVALS